MKARGERYWPGTRGWTRPARVVGHCPLLPVHIHTLHTPPLILLLAKAVILLKKDCFDFDDNIFKSIPVLKDRIDQCQG